MDDAEIQPFLFRAVDQLEQAAGIRGGDDIRAGGFDVPQLAGEQGVGGVRVRQVINTRAAAAPGGFGEFNEFQTGNRAEELARLRRDFLAVAEVAGVVLGD